MDKRTLFFVLVTTAAFFVINLFFSLNKDESAREALVEEQSQTVQEQVVTAPPTPIAAPSDEQFYVLENEFQQLVFSNVGGALAEINLPFKSEENTSSVVNQIGFDRTMREEYPYNDHFPDSAYFVAGESGPVRVAKRAEGGFYPLLRRSIIGREGEPLATVSPEFYAMNVVGKYPELAAQKYTVTHFDKQSITFESSAGGRKITKTYTLPDNAAALPYLVNVKVDVEGDRELTRGLWLTTGIPEVEILGKSSTNVLKFRQTRNGKSDVEKMSKPKLGRPVSIGSVKPDWIVNSNGFFGLIVDPVSEAGSGYRAQFVPGTEVPSRLTLIDSQHDRFPASRFYGYSAAIPLNPNGGSMEFRFFAGPLDGKVLRTIDATVKAETGTDPDLIGARTFQGTFSFISRPFSKVLFVIMSFFHLITRSWVVSIILLTVVVKAALYPLSAFSMKSMRRMQKIQPEVKRLQAKFKGDPRRAQQEVMQLYRKKRVNPLMGCLPLIIQMPFLIGMFDLLKSTYALRGTSFIPGWIDNLTAPDVLFSWSQPIFFIGTEFHLLPILLGVVMFIQQRFSSKLPADKSTWTDQQKQQRMMGNVMVFAFGFMFYNFPAGLCIYWLSSMLLGILQQWWINRQIDREPDRSVEIVGSKKKKKPKTARAR